MARGLDVFNHEPTGNLSSFAPRSAVKVEFARRLQKKMLEKGWNQSELSRRAAAYAPDSRLGRYSVSCYIGGKSLPRPDHLNALAKALGVKPEDLLPTRGVPTAETHNPPLDVKDIGEGKAWLRVSQEVDWGVALDVMKLLKANS